MTSRFIKEIDDEYILHVDKPTKSVVFDISTNINENSNNRKAPSYKRPEAYHKGDVVIHKFFGEGVVTNADNGYITVAFSYPHGIKTIKADHPSIRKKKANDYN